MAGSRPRILLTGFGPFPGAPVNPTAGLVDDLRAAPPDDPRIGAFRAETLDVEYATVADRLAGIGQAFSPDIAIHFGLAREASGFRLERIARNSHADARPDHAGRLPAATRVCAGPEKLESTLPLAEIHARLQGAGLPVEWSDDAGGYLCNTVFVLSRFHACPEFRPSMAGFVHVPLSEGQGARLSAPKLKAGARLVVTACLDAWFPSQAG